MSIQPDRPMIDVMREALHKLEAELADHSPGIDELKARVLRRIAQLETAKRLTLGPRQMRAPKDKIQ